MPRIEVDLDTWKMLSLAEVTLGAMASQSTDNGVVMLPVEHVAAAHEAIKAGMGRLSIKSDLAVARPWRGPNDGAV